MRATTTRLRVTGHGSSRQRFGVDTARCQEDAYDTELRQGISEGLPQGKTL
jgi:hypothetical protein